MIVTAGAQGKQRGDFGERSADRRAQIASYRRF
jgi:hypothetical protein